MFDYSMTHWATLLRLLFCLIYHPVQTLRLFSHKRPNGGLKMGFTLCLAFLPQFVVEGTGLVSAQLFLHGILILVVAMFIEPPLVLIASKVNGYLKSNAKAARWMD